MEDKNISWSAKDYETEEERKKAFADVVAEYQKRFRKEAPISLEEYKKRVAAFYKKVQEELIVDAEENEFYHVYNTCRRDIESKYAVSYAGMFRQVDKINEMIFRADDNIYGELDDIEDDVNDIYWWSIDKYRMIDGEYEKIYHINQYGTSHLFGISFIYKFPEHATAIEKEIYYEWEKLNGWSVRSRIKIEYPYQKGDILRVDNKPYSSTPDYFVYLENGIVFKKDTFGALSYQDLFSDGGTIGFYSFLPCHIEVVPSSDDKLFDKIAYLVREKGDSIIEEIKSHLEEGKNEDFIDYMNRISEYEYELATGEKLEKEYDGGEISLKEYAELTDKTKKLFMTMFAEPLEADEVYLAKSYTRYDVGVHNHQEIFHDYSELIKYIKYEGPEFYNQRKNKEPLDKVMWWKVEKKKLFNSIYRTTMICELDASCNVISFELGDAFDERYYTDQRYKTLYRRMDIVNYDDRNLPKIKLPFEIGDILYAEKRPKNDAIECIYLGERNRSYGGIEHLCLMRIDNKYRVLNLKNLNEYISGKQPYFLSLEKRDWTLDRHICKAFNAIRVNKEVILKIIELDEKLSYSGPDLIGNYLDSVI